MPFCPNTVSGNEVRKKNEKVSVGSCFQKSTIPFKGEKWRREAAKKASGGRLENLGRVREEGKALASIQGRQSRHALCACGTYTYIYIYMNLPPKSYYAPQKQLDKVMKLNNVKVSTSCFGPRPFRRAIVAIPCFCSVLGSSAEAPDSQNRGFCSAYLSKYLY